MKGGYEPPELKAPQGRFAVAVARFNAEITEALLAACRGTLGEYGVNDERLDVFHVPGSFELPVAARALAETGRYAAIICLGCVIRGDTDHYEYVAGQTAAGIMQASLTTGAPVIFGVLTTNNAAQARERAGPDQNNKGAEAALAAIEMANVLESIREAGKAAFGFGDPR